MSFARKPSHPSTLITSTCQPLIRASVRTWQAHALTLSLLAASIMSASNVSAMTLSEAIERAMSRDPQAMSALANRDADREASIQERATLLPKVNAIGSINSVDSEIVKTPFSPRGFNEYYSGWSTSIELRQPLYRYDILARLRRANVRDTQAEMAYIQRQQALIELVAERYIGVLQANNELTLAQADATAIRKSLDDTRKRYDVQLVPGTDLKEAQARDDLSQANLLAAQQMVEAARDALDESTGGGREPLSSLNPNTALTTLDSTDASTWLARAHNNNPSYQLAKAAYEVAKNDVDSRRSEALPTVDIVAANQRQDQSDSRIGSRAQNNQIGFELKVPIFASGANVSRIRESQARLRATEADRNRIDLDIQRDTRRLVRDVQTAQAQARAYQRAVESAQAAQQATRYGYEAGKRTITDVLNAQSYSVQAQRNLDQSRYNILLKTLQLKQQTGDLNATEIAAIDQLLTPPL